MKVRKIRESELQKILDIDRDFYEGYSTPLEVLTNWCNIFPDGFLAAEEDGVIVGYVFVELFDKVNAVPFIHDAKTTHAKNGKCLYVSGFGVKDGYEKDSEALLQEIVKLAKSKNCKAIVWVAGERMKHDVFERNLIEKHGFIKKERIKKWESHPNRFVSDHFIWVKFL